MTRLAVLAGKLLVNFDKSLQEVIWESRWLRQLGLDIPQAAQAILLQEEKFSIYFQQLSQLLEVESLNIVDNKLDYIICSLSFFFMY